MGTKTLKDGAMGFGGPQAKDKDKGKKVGDLGLVVAFPVSSSSRVFLP